ncbi:hypothetical protein M9H77_06934 [Catharanthus roseus]|uniref:Uncharacterized protein n=1 Tax=Catharanthus roseus TaxID=4058 RepID=A0ACC0BTP3_CATRO|nr:hypothetical protein M9H77_06934 [Catharanthus roseus]
MLHQSMCNKLGASADGTSLVELNIVSFALKFDRNSLQHVYSITARRGKRYTMEFEGKGENVGGTLILCYGDLTINIHGIQFYRFHFKEFRWLLNFRKKMNGSLEVFKAHLYDLVKTTFGDGVFELNLKNLVEKHLVYSIAFIDFPFKEEALNESIVQNTKSCVKIEKQSLDATLLYSLTVNEFLDELIFKREMKNLSLYYYHPFKETISKTFLLSIMQVEESSEESLGSLEA